MTKEKILDFLESDQRIKVIIDDYFDEYQEFRLKSTQDLPYYFTGDSQMKKIRNKIIQEFKVEETSDSLTMLNRLIEKYLKTKSIVYFNN